MAHKGSYKGKAAKVPMPMRGTKAAHMMAPAEMKKMMGGRSKKK